MNKYRHWRVTIKERAMSHPITTELHGCYDRQEVIKHFGLDEPDVEWYKVEEITQDADRR